MSNKSKPLLKLQASRQLAFIFALLTIGTLICIGVSAIAWTCKLLLLPLNLMIAWQLLCRHAWRNSQQAIVALQQVDKQQWRLIRRDGRHYLAHLSGHSIVDQQSALLLFKSVKHRSRFKLIITSDSLTATQLRFLKNRVLATNFN